MPGNDGTHGLFEVRRVETTLPAFRTNAGNAAALEAEAKRPAGRRLIAKMMALVEGSLTTEQRYLVGRRLEDPPPME